MKYIATIKLRLDCSHLTIQFNSGLTINYNFN